MLAGGVRMRPESLANPGIERADTINPGPYPVSSLDACAFGTARRNEIARVERHVVAVETD